MFFARIENTLKMSKNEDPENYFYMCEECNLSFDDYDQHIKDYHADAVVVLKPEKNEETAVYEEMEVEYLDQDDAVPDNFQCPECFITFGMKKKYDKHIEMVHGTKTTDDFVVFAYDPATKKSKKLTFSMNCSPVDATTHSLVHSQYYNAFAEPPKQSEPDHRDMKPAFKRDKLKPWEASSAVTCDLCDSKFAHPGALKMHQKAHGNKKVRSLEDVLPEGVLIKSDPNTERYFCEICQRSFDMTFKELHIASHGEERIFCKICNRKFDTQENLDSHMRALPDHTPFNFGRRFETDPELLKKRPYECGFCGKRFHRPHEKVKHERIHDGTKPYNCEICLKKFRTNSSLVTHLRNHTDLRPFQCHVCDKRFNTSSNCTAHIATHFDERNFKCKECPKAFKTSKSLSAHKLRHVNAFPHQCPKCPRKFGRMTSVTKHLLTHESKGKIYCPLCAAVFSRKDFLQIHLDKDHVDEIDGFKSSPVLKNHIDAIHGTERNYACDVCGKLFKTSPQLAGHKQTHTRSHQCTTCNRRFASLYVLKQHMATHDTNTRVGRAPKYVCSVCGASFLRNLPQMYEAHMLEHNIVVDIPGNSVKKAAKSEQFLCNMCPKICKNSKQLRNHIEEEHMLAGGEAGGAEVVVETSVDYDT